MISFKQLPVADGFRFIWGFFINRENSRSFFESSIKKAFPSSSFQYAYPTQVHENTISQAETGGIFDNTDGLFSQSPNLVLSVYTADCLPLVAYSPQHKAFGIVHAGWKGIYKSIAPKLFHLLNFGLPTSYPIYLDILPHICQNCYTVGQELKNFFPKTSFYKKYGQLFLGLKKEIFRQLEEQNLIWQYLPGTQDTPVFSEVCNHEINDFPSHRKGDMGRIMSFCFLLSPEP